MELLRPDHLSATPLLRDAAFIIRRDGWFQKHRPRDNFRLIKSHCITSAIWFCATEDRPWASALEAQRSLCIRMKLETGPDDPFGTKALTAWNDAPGRTQAEVIAALLSPPPLLAEVSDLTKPKKKGFWASLFRRK